MEVGVLERQVLKPNSAKKEELAPYSILDLGYYLVNRHVDFGLKVSPNLTIPRIVFFAQLEYYKKTKTLLTLDDFTKSQFGVFNDALYREFSRYVDSEITERIEFVDSFEVVGGRVRKEQIRLSLLDKISEEDMLFLDEIVLKYSKYDIWELTAKADIITKELFQKNQTINISEIDY